jgi:mannose-6-phosphate isomerase-like protein (cupin superfamily)
MSIIVTDLAGGETIAAGALTIRILEDGSSTDHRLGVVEVTIPPHVDGPPQHVHRQHDETFYVVSGNPRFTCGVEEIDAQPGVMISTPIGTPHTFANPGDTPVVLLCTVTPDLYIDYFRELAQFTGGPPDPAAIAAIMAKYATEVVRPS